MQVFGPDLTEQITEGILGENGLFCPRLEGTGEPPAQPAGIRQPGRNLAPTRLRPLTPWDVGPGKVFTGPSWEVTAAPAEHVQPYLDSLAYRVDSAEGSVIFTGDTQPCDSVIELARDADVMLCMCWDDQAVMDANGEYTGQCGTTGAARMAQAAGVKKLVLVHIGPHLSAHGPMEQGIGDISRIYDGEVVFSEELMRLAL